MKYFQVFGALMRPLELVPVEDMDGNEKRKPLLQRMAEEKRYGLKFSSQLDKTFLK